MVWRWYWERQEGRHQDLEHEVQSVFIIIRIILKILIIVLILL